MDESYLHEHRVSGFGLTIDNYPLKPSGKGRRVVIVSALTDKGWLGSNYSKEFSTNMEEVYGNGSFRYWVANIGGDYHRNFNRDVFYDYFKDYVSKYLGEPSIIIMDRAKYHTIYPANTFIPSQARKKDLQA